MTNCLARRERCRRGPFTSCGAAREMIYGRLTGRVSPANRRQSFAFLLADLWKGKGGTRNIDHESIGGSGNIVRDFG